MQKSDKVSGASDKFSWACEELMDDRLWGQLPMELIEMILLWLPLASALRCRSVCKKWKILLQSQSYYRRQYQIEANRPWLFLCTSGAYSCAFDFALKRWHRIRNPAIHRASVVGAAGNLVCLGNLVADCKVLSLYDPVRKMLKQLVPMQRIQYIHKVSMSIDQEASGCHKIMVTGEEAMHGANSGGNYRLFTEVYESRNGFWRMVGRTLAEAKFGLDPGVWCNGVFYCIVELPYGVVFFDQKKGIWGKIDAAMPLSIVTPSLVECRGLLFMVGRNVNVDGGSIQIWELKRLECGKNEWIQCVQVPEKLYLEFMAPLGSSYSPLMCCGIGDWGLCVTTHLSPRVLVFNLCSKTWDWLPSDPIFPENRDFHLLAFPMEPSSDCQL